MNASSSKQILRLVFHGRSHVGVWRLFLMARVLFQALPENQVIAELALDEFLINDEFISFVLSCHIATFYSIIFHFFCSHLLIKILAISLIEITSDQLLPNLHTSRLSRRLIFGETDCAISSRLSWLISYIPFRRYLRSRKIDLTLNGNHQP